MTRRRSRGSSAKWSSGAAGDDIAEVLKAFRRADSGHFQQRYEKSARPFEWTFTRRDLHDLLAKLNVKSDRLVA
jgi:hypothetical protein